MKFSLSTNWCSGRIESAEEIAEKAVELGFEGLELGFKINTFQAEGFFRVSDKIKIGSVHAFCPVPISAPYSHPELYSLASVDENVSRLAAFHVTKSVEFASSVGATALVLHAGRVSTRGFIPFSPIKRRARRGVKVLDAFRRTLDALYPVLESNGVKLGLENLPYLDGFPDERELLDVCGEFVRPWLDTGHDFVRKKNGWKDEGVQLPPPIGMHLNDSKGGDDHLAPGEGEISFSEYSDAAHSAEHLVLEPNPSVSEESLKNSISFLRSVFEAHE
jgi:sugar phosphate isomerase/epimerase